LVNGAIAPEAEAGEEEPGRIFKAWAKPGEVRWLRRERRQFERNASVVKRHIAPGRGRASAEVGYECEKKTNSLNVGS